MVTKVHTAKNRNELPQGAKVITSAQMLKLNSRLRKAMQVKMRENQKKQMVSLQKAAKLILNA